MNRRMVACDLDGTLLDSRGKMSARTCAAARSVTKAGWMLVIATGRPVRDVRAIARCLDYNSIAVCGNGSMSYDFAEEAIVDYQPIGPTEARDVLRVLREFFSDIRYGAELELKLILEAGFAIDVDRSWDALWVNKLDAVIGDRGVGKIIAQVHGDAHQYHQDIRGLLPNGCELTVSTSDFCEITRAGVTKAAALARLAERFNYSPDNVIAFGDMPNDVPMLTWAGTAVAVANAHPEVLTAVDEVTLTNDADGVALYLERLLAQERTGR
jgi:Cof subfamily protein (haloacid dehalogenase superfamily)